MSRWGNEEGRSRIKVFLWFIFLFLVVHVGYKLVPMYMDYARMKDEMTTKASLAQVLKDDEIRRDLVTKANDLDLPLGPDSFDIQRDTDRRKMKISTSWDEDVIFLWGAYERMFHFHPVVEENIMRVAL